MAGRELPSILSGLRLPVVGSPMFIVSGPDLVIAQCCAGIVGSFPALNAREAEGEPVVLEARYSILEKVRQIFTIKKIKSMLPLMMLQD